MNFIGIIWILVIVFWVINRANKVTNTNTNTNIRKTTYSNTNTQSRPTRTSTTSSTKSNNIYATKDRDTVSKELKRSTADSIENAKALYESGIISKEEYREYKQRLR